MRGGSGGCLLSGPAALALFSGLLGTPSSSNLLLAAGTLIQLREFLFLGPGPLDFKVALLGLQALTRQPPGVRLFASSSFLLLDVLFSHDWQKLAIASSSVAFFPANPFDFCNFFWMSNWACPTKATLISHWFSEASGSKGVKARKASYSLS